MQLLGPGLGKWQGELPNAVSRKCSWMQVSAHITQHILAVTHPHNQIKVTCIIGRINNKATQMLLDSGASYSVVSKMHVDVSDMSPEQHIQLVNADGRSFTPLGTSLMTVTGLSVDHNFIVVNQLSIPVILGCDSMSQHGFILDTRDRTAYQLEHLTFKLPLDSLKIENCNAVTMDEDLPQTIPSKSSSHSQCDLPGNAHPALQGVIDEYKELFSQELGQTNITRHIIDTGTAQPVKIPA